MVFLWRLHLSASKTCHFDRSTLVAANPRLRPNPLDRCGWRFADLIGVAPSTEALSALRAAETIGHPLGAPAFLDRLAASQFGPTAILARIEAALAELR